MTKLAMERLTFFASDEAASLLFKVRDILRQGGIDCYLVGGFVRDGLLGQANSDIDVAVAGDATAIASGVARGLNARMVPLNEEHKVARVVLDHAGRQWHLDFATMRGSIEDDLADRDFTVNALAIDLSDIAAGWSRVAVVDPVGGQRDLGDKVVRAVSDAAFRRDPARLLRAVRLAATLDFSVAAATAALMWRDRELIAGVAPERLRDELGKIFESPRAYASLRQLDSAGLLDLVMPELAQAKGVDQPKEHFWDVFDHSLETVAAVERLLREEGGREGDGLLARVPWSTEMAGYFAQEVAAGRTRGALLKLAGLLHDLGKPETKTTEEDGRMRFLGHGREGAAMAVQLMERLRFSNREIRMVELMVEHHLRPGYLVAGEMPSRRAIYRYFRDTADVGIDTLFLGLADHLAARGPMLDPEQWRQHAETTRHMLSKWFEEQETVVPPKLIDGNALMEKFDLRPGPKVGELLEAVREAQAAGEIETAEEALNYVAERLGRDR